MNNSITKIAAIITMALFFVGCSSEDSELATQIDNNQLTISAGIPTTRAQYDHETVTQLSWSAGDSFQLYNSTQSGNTFTLVEGEGQISAKFSGKEVSDATKAFYPAIKASRSGLDEQSLLFSGQVQTANNSISHLSNYSYLLGSVSKNSQGKISGVSFKHLTARLKFALTLPSNFSGKATSLTLQTTSNDKIFYDEMYVDASNAAKDEMTSRLKLTLSNIAPDEKNNLVVFMIVAPTDVLDESIELILKSSDGSTYTATSEDFPTEMKTSNQYTITASFEKSSTTYLRSEYTLSADGKTFLKWNGEEKTLDFSADTNLSKVTTIASKAFEGNDDIETVILSENIKTIEEYAFYYCLSLSKIVLPASLESFQPAAVYTCPVSYSMSDDNMNYKVVDNVLYNKEMTTIVSNTKKQDIYVIPSTIKTVGEKAFSTPFLKELTIPQTLEEIKDKGLIGCVSVQKVLLVKADPSDLKVGENVFYYMPKNTTFLVPVGSKEKYMGTSPWKYQMNNIEETEMSSIAKLTVMIDDSNFDTSTSRYTATSDAQTLQATITSNFQWTVSSDATWISISQDEGENDATLNITIQSNGTSNRKGTILFSYGDETTSVEIFQAAQSDVTATQIPIIMHIIYDDASNRNQYPTKERLDYILAKLNELYDASDYRPDMRIDFVAATLDPNGSPLEEAGIHRHKVSDSNRSSKSMLAGDYSDFRDYFWEPSQYLNVFIFAFSDEYSGLADLPYMQSGYQMSGTNYSSSRLTASNFAAPFGLCLNNDYIYNESFIPSFAHEVGHILGLRHVFDNDYCDDTPYYDRTKYMARIADYLNGKKSAEESEAYYRYDTDGNRFISRNFMDYYVGYRDEWTNDQFDRMQYVLQHAQALPTASAQAYVGTTTRSASEMVYPEYTD